ncbi:MAG TPA: IPTL-CTERM sorting domain-containing protein [Thermodesulfobacteriota bacterium]|nr:IPTL-CTERM sorting domain-containing protein [Thermodesulfobacteriota bacterium]
MRYALNLISFLILAMLLGVGLMVLGTGQAWAGANPCAIGIEKIEIPDQDTPFDFEVTGTILDSVTLSDPSDPTFNFGINIDDTVTVTELVPPGWELASIECIEGTNQCGIGVFEPCLRATVIGNSVTFFCEDIDEAFCVFTNVRVINENIPTLSEWGLIAMAGIMGLTGLFIVMRRRKTAA